MTSSNQDFHPRITALAIAGLGAFLAFAASDAVAPQRDLEAAQACVPAPETLNELQVAAEAEDSSKQVLVEYLSRRFYIAAEATEQMVGTAYRAARQVGLDPLLVLAVISVESRFNPIAESVMGAKGLMQIIPKYHRAKLLPHGGEEAVLDPESNILVGAQILQEYIYRTGTLEAGLQFYNGALRDESASYAQKVMTERARLEQALHLRLKS
jgi:soluble lytic murein transglycosylase-like protein